MHKPTIVRVKLPEVCLPDTVFTPVPPATSCTPPPAGSTAKCTVSGVTCAELCRTNGTTVSGLQFLVTFTLNIDVISPKGATVCQTSQTSEFIQTVTLAARPGTVTFCQATFQCGPCLVIDDAVCCSLEACLAVWAAPGCPRRAPGPA